MNLTTKKMNLRRALFSGAVLVSMLGGIGLTASNPAQAQPPTQNSIADPDQPDVFYMSSEDIRSAERSLDRNNCALFNYGIKCAYGNAGYRHNILKSVKRGHAVAFKGNGKVLKSYINKVGLDEVVRELQRLDIDYQTARRR
ncbi:hypothetical protein L8106_23965 [Lyngbya sp. PCC 8106]|nr:hypothetical protein L8106_23965 [Lyngbya sp. PCC 8106]